MTRATACRAFLGARTVLSEGMALHMIKLVVGAATIEDMVDWRARNGGENQPWIMNTRMTPKRADELVEGGSLYRVFKGVILCRQSILAVDRVGEGVTARCEVTVSELIVRVAPTPRRAFPGWRYLDPQDAPPDLDLDAFDGVPEGFAAVVVEVGFQHGDRFAQPRPRGAGLAHHQPDHVGDHQVAGAGTVADAG